MATGIFNILDVDVDHVAVMSYENEEKIRYGFFNFSTKDIELQHIILAGSYTNLVNDSTVTVTDVITIQEDPIIIEIVK